MSNESVFAMTVPTRSSHVPVGKGIASSHESSYPWLRLLGASPLRVAPVAQHACEVVLSLGSFIRE